MAMVQKKNLSRAIFNVCNIIFMLLFAVSILIPFLNCIALSLSEYDAIVSGNVGLFPIGFNWRAYAQITQDRYFVRSFINTIYLTVVKTVTLLAISLMGGYAMQSKYCKHAKWKTLFIMIPMYFSGGLIPSYILINTWLNLRDNILALILPGIVSPFLLIFFRNSIANLPKEMSESAELDGASDFTVLTRILFPLIIPTVIAFVISNAVGYWNEWFNCMLYIQSPEKVTLQFQLRNILVANAFQLNQDINPALLGLNEKDMLHPQNIKMAALLVTILPIMTIYPFLQRYFIHGVMIGALKG